MLGLDAGADADAVRAAYRELVKKCHPDKFLDADERKAAQEKMIALNLAYEAALKLTAPRQKAAASFQQALSQEDALTLADKMLRRGSAEAAIRQLMRATACDGAWYAMQGRILMHMDKYESAHQSYREAVRREPNNIEFRRGAFDAAVAMKNARTPVGRLKMAVKRVRGR